ncbi:MAG: NAD(P)H-dependent glycerol-3-phosphate dehydrogenase [Holosporaceae bacterium]|jgi:glycerol-3-phosphate dehydrogenase (NAD(P)+)|nr:NAD(P)H-dependent glycerol-3-phosphate dehydrogenase [Holosporaceae bacterium]
MSNNYYKKIAIIGAGSYGTAIAQCFSARSPEILLISDLKSLEESINFRNTSATALLNPNISCSTDFSRAKDADIIFIAVPVSAVADVCHQLREHHMKNPVVLCSKGLDIVSTRLISDLVQEIIPNDVAVFSGPSFAHEVIRGLPFGVNVASEKSALAEDIAVRLHHDKFVLKPLRDHIGLQIAGAFKNILAVGCGIFGGLKLGNNAAAQLMVNGLGEMIALTQAMGGQKDTFWELGGVGDIILTCTSRQSRNVSFGEHLAIGGTIDNWNGSLAEGAFSAKAIPAFEKKFQVDLRIFHWIHEVIYKEERPSSSVVPKLFAPLEN